MTKCIIVGIGYFGKIIKSKLEFRNVEFYTVDPFNEDADFKTVEEVPFNDGKWFVTTPASTHHKILKQLFEKGVKDIWVEKPICSDFKDTLDIFATMPDDVFLYCDFTWLQHSAIKTFGDTKPNIKHVVLTWLNDGSMIPGDVNIVLDLAIHPLSILTYFLIKTQDKIKHTKIKYATKQSVIIEGYSENGTTFYIEVSNSSLKKYRGISLYTPEDVYRWNSENQFYIENIGEVEKTDAIDKNIDSFFNRINIGYPLDIARILEEVNKQFSIFTNV
mgnify:CR=1 FL=1